MKSWSAMTVAVIVISLASWLLIYWIDGAPPTPGITLVLVGFWLVVGHAVRWLVRRNRGGS